MSKRHQANRRRSYGRRQHELRERQDRVLDMLDQLHDQVRSDALRVDVAVRELGLPAYGTGYLGAE